MYKRQRSVESAELPPGTPYPPPPSSGRMLFHRMQVALEPLDATTTRATLLMSLDPQFKLVPAPVVEGALRRTLCLFFLQKKRSARRIRSGEGPHAAAVQADHTFYRDWLDPKVVEYLRTLDEQAARPA